MADLRWLVKRNERLASVNDVISDTQFLADYT